MSTIRNPQPRMMISADAVEHHCDEDDDPKRELIPAEKHQHPLLMTSAADDAPIWRLKRLRPAILSIGILACLTACLTGCAPFVPDLVRELDSQSLGRHTDQHHNQAGSGVGHQLVNRLLSLRDQCVAIRNRTSSLAVAMHCAEAQPSCNDLPALCRYRAGMLACQTGTPICLAACLCLLVLAACAARRCVIRCRLLLAALVFAFAGLAFTIAFVACLHSLVAALSSHGMRMGRYAYSADTTGARIAYAAMCLQTLLACQLAALPACLRRVAADRAVMLAWIRAE